MRITSGIFKGLSLTSPNSSATHPMGERERLALFNMIRPYLQDATVLDAYAGTGALGIEALSNGAKSVTFIDNSAKAITCLKQNLAKLPDSLDITVISKDLRKIPDLTPNSSNPSTLGPFSLIFTDPPYDHFDLSTINHLANLLAQQGIIIVSHPDLGAPLALNNCRLLKTRRYAAANLSLFEREI